VSLPLLLAALDAAAGIYLISYALHRERRDKGGVMVTGVFLLACAAALLVIGWPRDAPTLPGSHTADRAK